MFLLTFSEFFLYYAATFLLSLLLIIKLYYNYCFSYWKNKGLYTAQPSIPFGNARKIYLGQQNFGECFAEIYQDIKSKGLKHGGCYFWGKNFYIPTDINIIKKIIISDFEYFVNHGLYLNEESDPLTAHIFNLEDTKWKNLRLKLPSAFTSSKMRKMFVEMVNCQNGLVEILGNYAKTNQPADIKDVLSKFSTDIITRTAFGIETNCMKNQDMEFIKHGRSFFDDQWSVFNNTLVFTTNRKYLKMFNFKVLKQEAVDFFMKLFKDIKDHREKSDVKRNDLTDLLIRLTKENSDDEIFRDFTGKAKIPSLSFNEYAAQAYIFFEAGFETSSTTMTFALYELAKHPEYQKLLREEINEVLKKYDGAVTYDAMLEMQYLEKVVDETLRLYPPFPLMPRVCNTDYKIPGTDFVLEKNSLCLVTNMGIQRDPEFYPNPEVFDPERFSAENKAKRPSCSYMPFGEGPRICVGKRFGLLQSKAGLIGIIRNYEVSLNEKTIQPLKLCTKGLILKIKGDLWLDFKKI